MLSSSENVPPPTLVKGVFDVPEPVEAAVAVVREVVVTVVAAVVVVEAVVAEVVVVGALVAAVVRLVVVAVVRGAVDAAVVVHHFRSLICRNEFFLIFFLIMDLSFIHFTIMFISLRFNLVLLFLFVIIKWHQKFTPCFDK